MHNELDCHITTLLARLEQFNQPFEPYKLTFDGRHSFIFCTICTYITYVLKMVMIAIDKTLS